MWCQQRSLPGSDVEACRLEVIGHRLRVQAPARLELEMPVIDLSGLDGPRAREALEVLPAGEIR